VILLACAVEKELSFWQPRSDVEVLLTGVGPVEAACSIAHALAQRRYGLVVNAGLAGGFDGAVDIGQAVAVSDETLELGLESGHPIVLPDGQQVVDKARSDPHLVAAMAQRGYAIVRGITVARVTSSEETAARLARLGAQVETMEGFAVLRAAQRAAVPAIELRGISNRVGARERSGWDFQRGTAALERALETFFAFVDEAERPA
jgi:futalosine hydrolase